MSWGDGDFTVTPQTAEEIKDCATPDGIRRRLREVYYRHSDPLVRAIFQMAEARGLSGENMYVVMAFEALKQLEDLKHRHLSVLNTIPATSFPVGK